ncbi:putative dehydrogenase [Kribbella aluminosa]|uniref:Dehydrogenase n=1 Tax=Kribbella aluminosa TaxID=416017 RepID=A0ABS4UTX8_9ACTN|nr:Gfo/Idh/MocA family oxidoreductase [Kribbella aluminosa]MBP2355014.1 putative dehydrogenase [Kribbella aluminosa]
MCRVGIIGIENSHTDHFLRHLNEEQRFPGARVTAIVRGDADRVDQLRSRGPLEVLDSPKDLAGVVDAAIVCSRDGALHPQQAEPLLQAGIPVLIDKPLATTTAEAEALVAGSARAGAQLLSASAVRFTPEISELTALTDQVGPLQAVSVTGPADPDSPYSGIFFYGIHTVETALLLAGAADQLPDLERLTVHQEPSAIVATTSVGGVLVTMRFVVPDEHGQVPFHAEVVGRHGSGARDLTLGADYNLPLLTRFMAVVGGEVPQTDGLSLVTPIAVTERIRAQLQQAKELS